MMATYAPGTFSPQAIKFYQMLAAKNQPKQPRKPPGLQPIQQVQFQQGMSNANFDYGQALAQNNYARGQAAAGFRNQRRDLIDQFNLVREQMPYGANRAGVLGSGIWKQALIDANKRQALSLGQLAQQRAGQLGQFDLLRNQLEAQRARTIANLHGQKQGVLDQMLLGLNGYGG